MLRIMISVTLKVSCFWLYCHQIMVTFRSLLLSWSYIVRPHNGHRRKFSHRTLAQIHLCPLCYLGNLQSGVHVVRKTALNYSERENFRQTCGHTPPNMGLARRCMYHVTAINLTHRDHIDDIFAHYLQRMSLSIDGCIV